MGTEAQRVARVQACAVWLAGKDAAFLLTWRARQLLGIYPLRVRRSGSWLIDDVQPDSIEQVSAWMSQYELPNDAGPAATSEGDGF
jgi:hypothetical protein